MHVNPSLSEEMKLCFLWLHLHLRLDIFDRVYDEGPTRIHAAIQITQRMEATTREDHSNHNSNQPIGSRKTIESAPIPMDVDIKKIQFKARRALPQRDAQGHLKCFRCNIYEYVKKHCKKLQA
mgnify:CR=1 FL=1